MSKVDALRAMREEKYARLQAGAKARPAPAAKPAAIPASAAAKPAASKPVASKPEPAASGATCGHTSMNGRSCTREPGHPQKSHRYS